jgi:hypothetical protein
MNTRPSTPAATEKPVPVLNRRRVGVFIIASLNGLGLGLIGGIAAGFIGFLIGNALYPNLGMTLLVLLLSPIVTLPIVGLCTGLVAAFIRSAKRGSVIGALLCGGSQLLLFVSFTYEWMAVGPVVVVAAVIGALIGVMSAALSLGFSAHDHATLEAGK